MSLDELVHDPNVTPERIFATSDDPLAIYDAAAKVLAAVDRAGAIADEAIRKNVAAIERSQAALGTPGSERRIEELIASNDAAEQAMAAVHAAWDQYKPWREALDLLHAAKKFLDMIESN